MGARNILIIGFSGSGKTTTGQQVARQLGWRFLDLDHEVVTRAGRPIHRIYEEDGVGEYRRLERLRLSKICVSDRQVVATGAGTILDDATWQTVRDCGTVVALEASPETIYERLSRKYPNGVWIARGDDPVGQIRNRMVERQSRYDLAQFTVQIDTLTPVQAAQEVIRLCGNAVEL